MAEDKITLDRKAFRSLASDTRISILKSLGRRRKMLAELSKELGMSPSTVKEHMDSLRKSGLVVMKDDGHKWKYYELTMEGKSILHPGETRIWIVLSLSGLAFLVTAYDMLTGALMYGGSAFKANAPDALMQTTEEAAGRAAAPALVPAAQLPYFDIMGLVLFGAIFALALGYYLGARKGWNMDF
jgi:DNA-binding transcriptional ArsR family regulator